MRLALLEGLGVALETLLVSVIVLLHLGVVTLLTSPSMSPLHPWAAPWLDADA